MSDTQDDNIFKDGFSWGSWVTSSIIPKLLVITIVGIASGIGAITWGYYRLSWQMSQMQNTSCCGQVQDNKESVKELKRAVSILIKIHTSNGSESDGALDTLPDWSHSYNSGPSFKAPRHHRYEDVNTGQRHGYPVRFLVSKAIKPRDDKRKDRDS